MLSSCKKQRRLASWWLGFWVIFVLLYACLQPCPVHAGFAHEDYGSSGQNTAHDHERNDRQVLQDNDEDSLPHVCTHAEFPDIASSSARSNADQHALGILFKLPALIFTLVWSIRLSSNTAFVFLVKGPPPISRLVPVNTRLLL